MKSNAGIAGTLLVLVMSLPACTAEQAYGTGQAWQRSQCGRIPDKADYDRCVANTNTTYDSYKQQIEAAKIKNKTE